MGIETNRKMILDMPSHEYHRVKAYSSSALGKFAESMATGRAYYEGRIRSKPSPAMEFGIKAHFGLENRGLFHETYQVKPDGLDRRTKAGKEAYADYEAQGIELVDRDEWERLHGIFDAYEYSDDWLVSMCRDSEGERELSIFWNEQGLPFKARLDRLIRPSESDCEALCERFPSLFEVPFGIQIVCDFKTSSKSIQRNSFYWTTENLLYDLKAANYLVATGADAFMWIAMEVEQPFNVTAYLMKKERMMENIEWRRRLIEKIAECEKENHWPGIVLSDEERLI